MKVNNVEIPMEMVMDGYNWKLDLVVDNKVYYWQEDDLEDIALMYEVENNNLVLKDKGVMAYENMYEYFMLMLEYKVKPQYMGNAMKKAMKAYKG